MDKASISAQHREIYKATAPSRNDPMLQVSEEIGSLQHEDLIKDLNNMSRIYSGTLKRDGLPIVDDTFEHIVWTALKRQFPSLPSFLVERLTFLTRIIHRHLLFHVAKSVELNQTATHKLIMDIPSWLLPSDGLLPSAQRSLAELPTSFSISASDYALAREHIDRRLSYIMPDSSEGSSEYTCHYCHEICAADVIPATKLK